MTTQRGPNVDSAVSLIANDPLFNGIRSPIPASWYDANKRTYSLVDQDALYASLTYSRFYGRNGVETLSAPTDAAVITLYFRTRYGSEVVATPADAPVTHRTFVRNGAEVLPALVDHGFMYKNANTMVNPMVDRWP